MRRRSHIAFNQFAGAADIAPAGSAKHDGVQIGQFGHPGVQEQMQLVAERVTGETIPFCGHLLAEEQPEAVARAILAFCRG